MTFTRRLARAQVVLGVSAVVIGVWTFVLSRHVAFTASRAPLIGSAAYAFQVMSFNRLGALVLIVLGVIGIVAGAMRRLLVGLVPAAGFALVMVQIVVQWRPKGSNLLASTGSDLAFSLLLCVGFAVTAAAARVAAAVDAEGVDPAEPPI